MGHGSVLGVIDLKLEGAGVFLNIGRTHPSGVRDFLGQVFRIKGKFDPDFIAGVERTSSSVISIDEPGCVRSGSINFDLKVASVPSQNLAVGRYIGE
jgi:hypothetical protein